MPLFILANNVFAGKAGDTTGCPSSCCVTDWHTPLGVMTDHTHRKGEWGISYTYMNMQAKGNQAGTKSLTDDAVFATYDMAPDQMTMQMHMVMVMYGLTERLTLMGMTGFASNSMSMNMLPGMVMQGMVMGPSNSTMKSSSSGLGDSRVYGTYRLLERGTHRIILSLGLNIPTGSISQVGSTVQGEGNRLSYPMQLGSGTWDILPGISYSGRRYKLCWGLETDACIRPVPNMFGYALGNTYTGNAWLSYSLTTWISISLRAEELVTGMTNGYDPAIAVLASNDPTASTLNTGGQKTSLYLGVNLFKPSGFLNGNRILIEYGMPVYQNLNGIQMTTRGVLLAGWQYHF